MSNYINTIKDTQNNSYDIYDSRLKQGGTKAFWFTNYSEDGNNFTITLATLDGTSVDGADIDGLEVNDLVSFKAEFSASFIGYVYDINGSTITVGVSGYSGTDALSRTNFIPQYLGYSGSTNNVWSQVTPNNYYIKTEANSDEALISDSSDGSNPRIVKKYSLGYIWFPEKQLNGDIEIGVDTAIQTNNNKANEIYSFAEGYSSLADGRYSHSEGANTKAAYSSHAEGYSTNAYGIGSHTEGLETEALGIYSHAEGGITKSYGNYSHAEGYDNTVNGNNSHVEGYSNAVSGTGSHCEGRGNNVTSSNSHAEGYNNRVTQNNSHAEGYNNSASGNQSHAEGSGTTASGGQSHTEGTGTIAAQANQHVQGKYNVQMDATYADIVGWGNNTNDRKNISALTISGDLKLAKEVYVNCDPDSSGGTKVIYATNTPASTGTYVLKCINGVIQWVLES